MDLELDLVYQIAFMTTLWKQLKVNVPVKLWPNVIKQKIGSVQVRNFKIHMTSTYSQFTIARNLAMIRYVLNKAKRL